MKFRPIHVVLAIFFLLTLTAVQCERDPEFEWLPPETQTGANTFGALVNEELFLRRRVGDGGSLTAVYMRGRNVLEISCRASVSAPRRGAMFFEIYNPREGEYSAFSRGFFAPSNGEETKCRGFAYNGNSGRVFITKFDTINRIVSGRFEFSGRCSNLRHDTLGNFLYTGDSIIQVTDGRFDIRLIINQ